MSRSRKGHPLREPSITSGKGSSNHAIRPGFTLVEALAAVAILAIAMAVLIQSQTQSINNVMRLQAYEKAIFITENQLHWTMIDLNESANWSEYASLSGQDGDYYWSVTVSPSRSDTQTGSRIMLLHIVAETTWTEGRADRSFSLETYYLWGEEQ